MTDKRSDRGGAQGAASSGAAALEEAIMTGIIIPLEKKAKGKEVADLQDVLQQMLDRGALLPGNDKKRRELAEALKRERVEQVFSEATQRLVRIFQEQHRLDVSGRVDEATAEALNYLRDVALPDPIPERTIAGRIVMEHGLPAEKLKLRLVRRGFGGAATVVAETTTAADGGYSFGGAAGQDFANLEVRAIDGGEGILLGKPADAVATTRGLNLVAPAKLQPLAPEYVRLAADLTPLVGRMNKLAGAKETEGQQDLTVLNRATGWDARLIALASTSERLAADPDVRLPAGSLYALLRAGLPSDKQLLAQVAPDVAAMAMKKARDAGIVALSDGGIAEFEAQFATFAAKARLAVPAPGSQSSYGELLRSSGLPAKAQDKFAEVYLAHRGTGAELWEAARKADLDGAQIAKLQMQGKLAFLAGNSDAMTKRLLDKGLSDPVELVDLDFHAAATWKNDIFEKAGIPEDRRAAPTAADRVKLEAVIPPAYAGEAAEARLDAYAEDMARKVRLAYPTQVYGRLMETDHSFRLPADHDNTTQLLKTAAAQGFRLGETPVSTFLESNAGVQGAMSDAEFQSAAQQLKMLQSVYQITPNNEAMPVMVGLGMNSAFDVMAYSNDEFVALFNSKYLEIHQSEPPRRVPELISRKATQVSSVTYNLFTIAKKLDSDLPIMGMSASAEARESVKSELIKHFPTMEALFGSMDYCECEHCRSVLSPAAYLVDLLQFVDTEPSVWGNFLAEWKNAHGGQDYPHKDPAGTPMKPYDVLIERRPDLANIALTCENTNTALPYIDIVNEVLEYYVAHGKLAAQTAHDTGDATTEELLAEPQNVIRTAYDDCLSKVDYPIGLPFDLWIETVRQFCDYFETPLHRMMEILRPGDALFAPGQPFDRAAIFLESLGLSPAEIAIFANPVPLATWHELYGFTTAAEATTVAVDAASGQRIDLNSAKALSRRLGVTYKDIAAIVGTEFVNPDLGKLNLLSKLRVGIADARTYVAHAALIGQNPATLSQQDQQRQLEAKAFRQARDDLAAAMNVPEARLEAAVQAMPFANILVLADPDAGCNFDLTILRYADGTPADPIAFLRINLFVRLWRKLGWTIEETDRALCAFIPKNAPFDGVAANLTGQPLKTALIHLAHLKTLDGMLKVGRQSRLKLLALWSNLATTGKKPLYEQLFLTRGVLESAPQFNDPLGQYLSDPAVKFQDHALAVQGALALSADEVGLILKENGQSVAAAILSLPNVSLLYRYGLLAKALKLQVAELIALKQLSGVNPFETLHPQPLATLQEDHPFSQTLEFVRIAQEVKDSGLKVEDLDYLLRHRFDETGKYRRDPEAALAALKGLADGVRAIRDEHAVPGDPAELSDDALRQKLGLALSADVVARFTALMNGTAEFAVTRAIAAGDQLAPADFAAEPSITVLPYNTTANTQTLVRRGLLTDAHKSDLTNRFKDKLSTSQKDEFADLLDAAQIAAQTEAKTWFDAHLLKSPAGTQPESGFLDATDLTLLFEPGPPGLTEAQGKLLAKERRARLAKAFLPFLQQRLIRQFVIQAMTAQTGADPALVESLLTDARLLGPTPLLDAFAATGARAVTATFFASADMTGAALPAVSLATADTGALAADGTPLKPATAKSARLEGYFQVPATGAYRFFVELDKQNAAAELRFAHLAEPKFLAGAAAADNDVLGEQPNEFLELKAGLLYRFSLDLKKLGGGNARLLVQGETLAKGPLSQLTLYAPAAMDAAQSAGLLLSKALLLAQSLNLNEREIRYLLTHAADFDDVSVSELPTVATGSSAAATLAATQRFGRFRRLAAYARLKRELAGGTDDLIGIFEANGTAAANKLVAQVYPRIARLARRDEATVKATAEALAQPATPSFANEQPLARLWEALQMVERFGVPPAALAVWTGIANGATAGAQRFEIARGLKAAIKARFEPENWHRVAQPIFDKLRQRQRNALAAYGMHQNGLERLEQLYELFLIDPGMEPVVQTSRIRLAIASLQLFIQRCLLNLEPKVHPSTINGKQWEWMKRYRVWEANRKIFLFPENWLEPEFRDDKTHLFAELEGTLLQGDVSSDVVEDAFLTYLRKLDELARLDIVGMHIEDNHDPALRTLHVFGRTYGVPHKYFYRRYARGAWTPWEPVTAEIEGDHLAPVVWRDRLYLFWVTFIEKANTDALMADSGTPATGLSLHALKEEAKNLTANPLVELQLHWSEYVNGQWSVRESGGFSPSLMAASLSPPFGREQIFVYVVKRTDPVDGAELGVEIHLSGPIGPDLGFYLASRNSAPETAAHKSQPVNPFASASAYMANRHGGSGAFTVTYRETISTESGAAPAPWVNSSILRKGGGYTVLPCDNDLTAFGASIEQFQGAADPAAVLAAVQAGIGEIATLSKPVFYQDNRHTFFVEPDVTERTIEQWEEWVSHVPYSEPNWNNRHYWDELPVFAVIPRTVTIPPDFQFGPEVDPVRNHDWLVNPGSVVQFGDTLIGPSGQPGLTILGGADPILGQEVVNFSTGSGLAGGDTVVLSNRGTFSQSGLAATGGGLNIIGGGGFNAALATNFQDLNRSGSAAFAPGAGLIGQ